MRALRWHGKGDLRIDDVPEPVLAPGTVRVQVSCCGICGSDLHEYLGGPISIPECSPHPYTGVQAPVTLGHELGGTVIEVADDVVGIVVGDRVTTEGLLRCNDCAQCRAGRGNLCERLHVMGYSWPSGGFAPVAVLPAYATHVLPEGVSLEEAALIEPFAVGLHAVRRANVGEGTTAVVFGAGPIGLMTVLALRGAGAGTVVVAEPSPTRREAALRAGADHAVDARDPDVAATLRSLVGGAGADVVFDVAGVDASFAGALSVVRPHGVVVNVAAWEKPTTIQPNDLLFSEAWLTGSLGYAGEFPEAIRLIDEGAVQLDWMISRRLPLEDAIEHGFDALAAGDDGLMKVLIQIDGGDAGGDARTAAAVATTEGAPA
jgi:(R,R)-butanediol dehydrogenase/meso-butanediol dehydrogenase/diacetyl reductase